MVNSERWCIYAVKEWRMSRTNQIKCNQAWCDFLILLVTKPSTFTHWPEVLKLIFKLKHFPIYWELLSSWVDGCLSYTALEECALLLWTATPMLSNSATVRTPTATARAAITPVKDLYLLELKSLKIPQMQETVLIFAGMWCKGSVSLPVLDHLALNPHSAFQSSVKTSCIRSVNTVRGHGFKPVQSGTGFG